MKERFVSETFWGAVETGVASRVVVTEEVLAQRVPSAPMKQAIGKVTAKISGLLSDFFDEEFKRLGGRLVSALFSSGKVVVRGEFERNGWSVDLTITYPFVPGLVMWKMERVNEIPWRAIVSGYGIEGEERVGAMTLSATSVVTLDDFVEALGVGKVMGSPSKGTKLVGA